MVLKKYLTALMLGSLLLVSCQDELSSSIVINGAKVRAACSSKESPATKGAPLTAVPDNFSVWGYAWKTSDGSQTTPGWMPEKFFLYYSTTTYNWNNLPWMNNFWNAAMTASGSLADDQASAVKTIYDPCPAGWMLRSGRASTGFTTTGSRTTFPSECNVIGCFANGWTFKKNASDAVGTYYPAPGFRTGGVTRRTASLAPVACSSTADTSPSCTTTTVSDFQRPAPLKWARVRPLKRQTEKGCLLINK